MHIGHINKLFPDKGYGSIKTKSGKDLHFHKQCLWDIQFAELIEGQEVEFEIQESRQGLVAFHIRSHITNRIT